MKLNAFKHRSLIASPILTLIFASIAVALPSFAESNSVSLFVKAVFLAGETFEKQNAKTAETKTSSLRLEAGSGKAFQSSLLAAQDCAVLDNFNRADSTNMGANWMEFFGDMQILNNRAVASVNGSRLIFNGTTTGDRGCADVFAGQGLQFGGIYLKWTSANDHLFVKVQDNDGNGSFERVFFMRENSLGFNLPCNGGFPVSSPFSSARLYTYIEGSTFVLDIDTNFDGNADQTYSCGSAPAKSGTGVGLGFYGQSALDNFGIPSTTLTVTKTADTNDGVCDADCSLREAIAAAAPGDTIEFASPLFDSPQEIQISGQLFINKNLTINGKGANLLTVRQMTASQRVFEIRNVTTASLSGMTITGGNLGLGNGAGITANYSNSPVPSGLTLNFSGLNITGNTCGGGGCGINATSYNLNLLKSTVSNNVSSFSGGVLTGGGIQFQNGSTFNLINSTVSGNRAGNVIAAAGGIWFNGSTANIINSTITDNEIQAGNDRAGGVYNRSGTINVRNSIIAGNRNNANVPDVTRSSFSSIVSNGNNIIGSAPASIGFTDNVNNDRVGNQTSPLNPRLGPLQFNSGAIQTHRLLPHSPAIDKGAAATDPVTMNPIITDQRGLSRPVNLNDSIYPNAVSGDGSDIGAFEAQSIPTRIPLDFDGDGKSDYAVVQETFQRPEGAREGKEKEVVLSGDLLADESQRIWTDSYNKLLHLRSGRGFVELPADVHDSIAKQKADGVDINPLTEGTPVTLNWLIRRSSDGVTLNYSLGTNTDVFVPADYDGDGRADSAVWNPVTGFTVIQSSTLTTVNYPLGIGNTNADPTVVGDYDGDGIDDPAIYDTATGVWSWLGGATHTTADFAMWMAGGIPAPGDYNGDGKMDFAIQLPPNAAPDAAKFRIAFNDGSVGPGADMAISYGLAIYAIVPGDYDGDGKCDIAQANLMETSIAWRVLMSSTNYTIQVKRAFGVVATDRTVQGDYDGDGKLDLAVYRRGSSPEDGVFIIFQSSTSTSMSPFDWGDADDYPIGFFNTH